jgi:transposase
LKREYTKEFKRDAISLVIEQGYSKTEAAKSLGIHPAVLGRWVREYQDDEGTAFRGRGKRPPGDELSRLREENKRLKMEKEILKKAAIFFAKETK